MFRRIRVGARTKPWCTPILKLERIKSTITVLKISVVITVVRVVRRNGFGSSEQSCSYPRKYLYRRKFQKDDSKLGQAQKRIFIVQLTEYHLARNICEVREI